MTVTLDRSTFDQLMSEPYSVLATYLAYQFFKQEAKGKRVSQYALYKRTRLTQLTVKKAWRRLVALGLVQ